MLVTYEFPYTHAMAEIKAKNTTETQYPNLFAEWAASPYHLWVLCEQANMERDIMKAVLYNGEGLTIGEAQGLYGLFGGSYSDSDYTLDYLFSSELTLIVGDELQTRAVELSYLFNSLKEYKETLNDYQCSKLRTEIRRLQRIYTAEAVPYADYRRCKMALLDIRAELTRPTRPKRRNTLLSEEGDR